ncbi:hypothetical protein MN608_00423 [Microdochium nivale]|nr:hypothetical protein MN608_00423 [Microdochium nivale]
MRGSITSLPAAHHHYHHKAAIIFENPHDQRDPFGNDSHAHRSRDDPHKKLRAEASSRNTFRIAFPCRPASHPPERAPFSRRTIENASSSSPSRYRRPQHVPRSASRGGRDLCGAFAAKSAPPAELVSRFFASSSASSSSPGPEILALEHGLATPALATHRTALLPFLGQAFRGAEGVQRYFETVGGALDYDDMRFSLASDDEEKGFHEYSPFVVDVEGRQVCVKGRARFTARATGQSWDESFIYKLGYTFEKGQAEGGAGGGWKVVRFEVWADPAGAYLATRGEL